jgi:hypothetical protein
MGISYTVPSSTPSSENLPAFSSVLFNNENVLLDPPEIKSFGKANSSIHQLLKTSGTSTAKKGVLESWNAFRAKYTKGGQGMKATLNAATKT